MDDPALRGLLLAESEGGAGDAIEHVEYLAKPGHEPDPHRFLAPLREDE